MVKLTRRGTLLGGSALAALAACGQKPSVSAATPETDTAPAPAATTRMDGTAMAAAIASGETTALEQVNAAIARAQAVNGQLNAIASDIYDIARADAGQTPAGPFQGVPTFIKDLHNWNGAPTYYGSRAFKGYMPGKDDPLPAKWRAEGVVVLGKTTSPEMGLMASTEPLVTGDTRNPWDTTRIVGGSSGGSAALVAARVVPFAHASDGGGSIRIPASTCGVFGLKPSRGQLPAHGAAEAPPVDISVQHAVTISVRDSANLFRDTQTNDGTYQPLAADLSPLKRRLKIGFSTDAFAGTPVAAETKAALEDVAKLCTGLGHEIVAYTPSFSGLEFLDKFLLYWAAGAAEFAQQASDFSGKPIGPDIVEPWTLGLTNMFMTRRGEMDATVAWLKAFEAAYDSGFTDQGIDVLLTPVTGSPAVKLGEQAPTVDFDTLYDRVVTFAAFTAPMNVSGAASMSVPLSWSPSGLPIGSMFSGKRGDDGLLFELALELEAARPWADRLPGVVAS
ncbi:amidase family protein [Hyphomonas johnsonii]|uniref:Putative 6-aminohexanoate-cyclic-dimer hydrolase n=1 Tax=Hyphomonas johnsonii MHS-2 TaxID=1280950 RepID=A0A059FE75_9PROT|nr:amidase family protein [Hyphomonas johnsonii]KCZ88897.1 putative 6-aminohexanoate-cyclic-dimer hydrolase [Hyphomonas johnsonii MHS-2]